MANESRPRPAALDHEVVIVGSGFSGIGAAVALQRLGIQDFVILERESRPGGTWVQHDYPGLEVDMPFFTYSTENPDQEKGPASFPTAPRVPAASTWSSRRGSRAPGSTRS